MRAIQIEQSSWVIDVGKGLAWRGRVTGHAASSWCPTRHMSWHVISFGSKEHDYLIVICVTASESLGGQLTASTQRKTLFRLGHDSVTLQMNGSPYVGAGLVSLCTELVALCIESIC